MNRKKITILIILIAVTALVMSCSQNFETAADSLEGIWVDEVNEDLAIEFKDDGTARMTGSDINDLGANEEFNWSISEYYLEMDAYALFYSTEFVYEFTGTDTLTLYLTAKGIMNSYFENMSAGDSWTLTKRAESVFWSEVVSELDDSDDYDFF